MSLLVVFDVDSTLIQQEVIELLADQAGVGRRVHEVTERAMAGQIDFAESLALRVSLLSGLDSEYIQKAFDQIEITPGVQELISAVHSSGGKVAAVSGGFNEILEPLAKKLGLDFFQANNLEVIDGKLTGKVVGEIIDRAAKAKYLIAWAKASGVELSQTVAVGDGANDLDMFGVAGLSVAFRAKPIVREAANIAIEENSLIGLIKVLGLSSS